MDGSITTDYPKMGQSIERGDTRAMEEGGPTPAQGSGVCCAQQNLGRRVVTNESVTCS